MEREEVKGFTIDGKHSRDLDDAIWVTKNEYGYDVLVSIADVSEIVALDGEIDKDAFAKVETQYLRNFNKPMLPPELANNQLSLLPGDPKNTLSIHMTVSLTGEVLYYEPKLTVLKGVRRYSYEKVNTLLNYPEDNKEAKPIRLAQELAEILYANRIERGALAIYEFGKSFTDEDGNLIDTDEESFHAQMIVQEFMIIANHCFAKFLVNNDCPALYKVHPVKEVAPDRDKILSQLRVCSSIKDKDAFFNTMKSCFEKSRYSESVSLHWGLNLAYYGHFTSPIRRYADLVNHRIVKAIMSGEPSPYTKEQLKEIAVHINNKRKEKEEIMKSKTLKSRRNELKEDLSTKSTDKFSKLLKRAIKDGIEVDMLDEEVQRRVNDRELQPIDYYYMLAHAYKDSAKHIEKLSAPICVMVLEIFKAKKEVDYSFECNTLGSDSHYEGCFQGHVKMEGGFVSDKVVANSKKDVKNYATKSLLTRYATYATSGTVVPETVFIVPGTKPIVPKKAKKKEVKIDSLNYVGSLQQFCQQMNLDMPEYEFEVSGPSHDPKIQASVKVGLTYYKHDNEFFSSKKLAKQDVAKGILKCLISN